MEKSKHLLMCIIVILLAILGRMSGEAIVPYKNVGMIVIIIWFLGEMGNSIATIIVPIIDFVARIFRKLRRMWWKVIHRKQLKMEKEYRKKNNR